MLKFNPWPNSNTTLFYLKCSSSPQPSPIPSSSIHFDSIPFQVSYLIKKFDFSPKLASKLCFTYRLGFKSTENPDSVLDFFTDYGFSHSQLRYMVSKSPWLLSCNLYIRVYPKFEFFLSKGASRSDIINMVSKKSRILSPSLENHTIPTYNLLYRFLKSDKGVIDLVIRNPDLLYQKLVPKNITMLIENGVSDSNIEGILRYRNQAIHMREMASFLQEVKDLGFNPSKRTFGIALVAKTSVNKTRWEKKVDVFKKWGWSDEDVIKAFRRQPYCMLTSIDKINSVMDFWVNQLGWDVMTLAKRPGIFSYCLEKRIIPRATVVQFLLDNGLRNKNASFVAPFEITEEMFLDRCIKRFENEFSYLIKLYEEKLKLACHD